MKKLRDDKKNLDNLMEVVIRRDSYNSWLLEGGRLVRQHLNVPSDVSFFVVRYVDEYKKFIKRSIVHLYHELRRNHLHILGFFEARNPYYRDYTRT